jgi:ketosteroid isomerase-like protein
MACVMVSGVLTGSASAQPGCAPAPTARAEVVATVRQIFEAARRDDLAGFAAITTPDFYAYDGGRRFEGRSLMELIGKAHAAGKRFEWNVTDPEVHVNCNVAWVTYVNKGSVTDDAGRQDVTWLESVILDHAAGHWRAHFLHSTRVAASP